jgi:hypothetical protein
MSAKATNVLNLPTASFDYFALLANDAGNWSGNPYFDGNVSSGRSTSGYVRTLKAAGLIESQYDEDARMSFAVFTDEGIRAAALIGIDLTYINEDLKGIEIVTAQPVAEVAEVKPAKAKRATKAAAKPAKAKAAAKPATKAKAAPVVSGEQYPTDPKVIRTMIKVARDRRWRAGRREDAATIELMNARIVQLTAALKLVS